MRWQILALSSVLVWLFWGVLGVSGVSAQEETPQPHLEITLSFEQNKIRLNAPVMVTLWVSNQSDVAVTAANLVIEKPDFILVHRDSCNNPAQTSPIDLGALPPHTIIPAPISFCLTLERQTALTGDYNILTGVLYSWEQGTDIVSVEKPLRVDLIGTDTILGVPLGFAGFVLPGLMLLVALRWFKVPIANDVQSADRLIYGVLLSLILLGPFSWLATQPGAPAWMSWLDFQQQVSIERLIIFVLVGLLIGVVIGLMYFGWEWQKKRTSQFQAALQINPDDRPHTLLKKALLLNPKFGDKRILLEKKDDHTQIFAYHYAFHDKSLYVFAQFQLIISLLPSEIQEKVRRVKASAGNSQLDSSSLLSILKLLKDDHSNAFLIANPVSMVSGDGKAMQSGVTLGYLVVEPELYFPPRVDGEHSGYLLEVLDEMPY
jgi:hypothetical protein